MSEADKSNLQNKDKEYRNNLKPEQLAKVQPNPVGEGELSDDELEDVSGGLEGAPIPHFVKKHIAQPKYSDF